MKLRIHRPRAASILDMLACALIMEAITKTQKSESGRSGTVEESGREGGKAEASGERGRSGGSHSDSDNVGEQ